MTFKTIIKGRLEFGSTKSYGKVVKMFQWRVENFHKNDVLLNEEECFNEEDSVLSIPRLIAQSSLKTWRNTISLLDYLSQYAVAGNVSAWQTENGSILRHEFIEPNNDRTAVTEYLKGRQLAKESGKYEDAIIALDTAIKGYSKHAQAYERRAYVNHLMEKYHDAIRDYTKSIDAFSGAPEPFYGRGIVHHIKEEYEKAVVDFSDAVKRSIPLQPIHYKSRRRKAYSLMQLKEYEEAAKELRFFVLRKFTPDNPNYQYRRWAFYHQGLCFLELNKPLEAVKAFEQVFLIEAGKDNISEGDKYLYRGVARQQAGLTGFLEDFEKAKSLGAKKVEQYLVQFQN